MRGRRDVQRFVIAKTEGGSCTGWNGLRSAALRAGGGDELGYRRQALCL